MQPVPSSSAPASPVVPAGWYPDPVEPVGNLRYWDGAVWTPWQSRHGRLVEAPLGGPVAVGSAPPAGATDWTGIVDERHPWPRIVVAFAVVAIVVAALGSIAAVLLLELIGFDGDAVRVGAGLVVQDGLLVGAAVLAAHRWGSGRGLRADVGLRYERRDVWRGALGALSARVLGGLAVVLVLSLVATGDVDLAADRGVTEGLDASAVVVYGLAALVLAPVVEELFFRGVLQRAAEGLLGRWPALLAQGVLFGALHLDPTGTWVANLVTLVAISTAGITFGWLYHRTKRLGPCIAAHGWFNLVAVVVLGAGLVG